MTREWKPGTVAMLQYRNYSPAVALFDGGAQRWTDAEGATFDGDEDDLTITPLVVIDPEDDEQIERLAALYNSAAVQSVGTEPLQAALREFANPTPPKPDEPTGIGAVVEAVYDNRFVRIDRGNKAWRRVGDIDPSATCSWEDIDAVRVLSEGVTS